MNREEVKDCPFCKGKARAAQSVRYNGDEWEYSVVGCSKCHISIGSNSDIGFTISQWNNRPIEDELLLKIKKEINALIAEFQDLYDGDLSGEAVLLLLIKLRELIK